MDNDRKELEEFEFEQAYERLETLEEYQKIIRIALGKWLSNLQAGDIKLNTITDLKILIEADLMLKNDC